MSSCWKKFDFLSILSTVCLTAYNSTFTMIRTFDYYSPEPVEYMHDFEVDGPPSLKPIGLWLPTDNYWQAWSSNISPVKTVGYHQIVVDMDKVYLCDNSRVLYTFTQKYKAGGTNKIDWMRAAADMPAMCGIYVSQDMYNKHRLDHTCPWVNTLDSGCAVLWRPSGAVEGMTPWADLS